MKYEKTICGISQKRGMLPAPKNPTLPARHTPSKATTNATPGEFSGKRMDFWIFLVWSLKIWGMHESHIL